MRRGIKLIMDHQGCLSSFSHHHQQLLLPISSAVAILILLLPSASAASSSTNTKQFHFNVEWKSITRLCYRKPVLTVNGKFPGPTIAVHEGDTVRVIVTNSVLRNTTIHWHGVKQKRSGWADGPAYITQCPIGEGRAYTYSFTVEDQRGTLWWHAHIAWQRASVYGAFIIQPRMPPPFSPPLLQSDNDRIQPIVFGEWWNRDVEVVESEMMLYGGGPNSSDAYTINGFPGPLYPCSFTDTFIQRVEPGKTYLLRIINAALNNELFFAVANHNLTVVEIDGGYTKPFITSAIMIAPGQTTNVLITADQVPDSTGMFIMAARPYRSSLVPFDNSTAIGFLKYQNNTGGRDTPPMPPYALPPNLPALDDTPFARQFSNSLRSLASTDYPCRVPKKIDKQVVTTIGLSLQDCPANQTCQGLDGKRMYASMNNQSFVLPSISILESHYHNLQTGYSEDFPEKPPQPFNYTGVDPMTENTNTVFGTRVLQVPFGTRLEIVLQGTNLVIPENHPIHFHGHNFFIVGRGLGNFDGGRDPRNYNLVDPPERNTVVVPTSGWAAIRLIADNPGVWFMHCHLEEHTSWGLASALVVTDGKEPMERLPPPPTDLPRC